jgi:hypothetical protein
LAFGAPARFAPSRASLNSYIIGLLLGCLVDVPEDGQQRVKLGLGSSSEGFHLTVISALPSHWWAPSMAFVEDSLPDSLLRNNSNLWALVQFDRNVFAF